MDLNQKIAARRAELAQQAKDAAAEQAAEQARLRAEEARRREAAVDTLAERLSARGDVEVERVGEELRLPPTAGEVKALEQTKLSRLLRREAFKLWTQTELRQVCALLLVGVLALPLHGAGLVLILIGLVRARRLDNRYKAQVLDRHPELFEALTVEDDGSPPPEPTPWQKLWWNPHARRRK